jgi:hypothetical protein
MAPPNDYEERPTMSRPRDHHGFQELNEAPNLGNLAVQPGETAMSMMGQVIVAQRIVVPRNMEKVMQRIRESATFGGDRYIYSWPVKNRRTNQSETIEGPTIKLANDIARAWGNCGVDVRAFDFPEHWIFYARFSDYETGFQLTRAFQQRKAQNIGMADKDRALDIAFQIGQSKALRNVVVNALSDVTEYAMEVARGKLMDKFSTPDNVKKAWDYIFRIANENDVDPAQIARVYGKPTDKFTVRDLAKLYTQMRGIDDGLSDPADIFPPEAPAGTTVEKQEPEQKVEDRPAGSQTAGTGDSPAGTPQQGAGAAPDAAATTGAPPPAASQPQDAAAPAAEPQRRGRGRPPKQPPQQAPANAPAVADRPAGSTPAGEAPKPQSAPAASHRQPSGPVSGDPFANME